MTKGELNEKVKNIIVDKIGLDIEEIKEESVFDDLGLDDLDFIEVIMGIENEFNISINDSELDEIKTFKYLVDIIHDKLM